MLYSLNYIGVGVQNEPYSLKVKPILFCHFSEANHLQQNHYNTLKQKTPIKGVIVTLEGATLPYL